MNILIQALSQSDRLQLGAWVRCQLFYRTCQHPKSLLRTNKRQSQRSILGKRFVHKEDRLNERVFARLLGKWLSECVCVWCLKRERERKREERRKRLRTPTRVGLKGWEREAWKTYAMRSSKPWSEIKSLLVLVFKDIQASSLKLKKKIEDLKRGSCRFPEAGKATQTKWTPLVWERQT